MSFDTTPNDVIQIEGDVQRLVGWLRQIARDGCTKYPNGVRCTDYSESLSPWSKNESSRWCAGCMATSALAGKEVPPHPTLEAVKVVLRAKGVTEVVAHQYAVALFDDGLLVSQLPEDQ